MASCLYKTSSQIDAVSMSNAGPQSTTGEERSGRRTSAEQISSEGAPLDTIPDGENLTRRQAGKLKEGDPIRHGDEILEVDQIEYGPFLYLSAEVILYAKPEGAEKSAWVFSVG